MLPWKNKKVLNIRGVSLYSCLAIRHANRTFSAPFYIAICRMSGSTVSLHIKKKAWFSAKLLDIKCVILFSLQHSSETLHSKKNSASYRQICEKSSNIKFRENPSCGIQVDACERSREQAGITKTRSCLSQLCKRSCKPLRNKSQFYKRFANLYLVLQ